MDVKPASAAMVLSQREIEHLRDTDPIGWLRDKAERRVAADLRGRLNAAAALRICTLAQAALDANLAVCVCVDGAAGSHREECPCYGD